MHARTHAQDEKDMSPLDVLQLLERRGEFSFGRTEGLSMLLEEIERHDLTYIVHSSAATANFTSTEFGSTCAVRGKIIFAEINQKCKFLVFVQK